MPFRGCSRFSVLRPFIFCLELFLSFLLPFQHALHLFFDTFSNLSDLISTFFFPSLDISFNCINFFTRIRSATHDSPSERLASNDVILSHDSHRIILSLHGDTSHGRETFIIYIHITHLHCALLPCITIVLSSMSNFYSEMG